MQTKYWFFAAALGLIGCMPHGIFIDEFNDLAGLSDTDSASDTEEDKSSDPDDSDRSDTTDTGSLEYETGGCGDGFITAPEVCDDANNEPGDGCATNCLFVEANFVCPTPGVPCVSTVVCGDGLLMGSETCDDGNDEADDGCAGDCQIETGWICPVIARPCEAEACGDGIIAGNEECEDDDDPPADGDGCTALCKHEDGFACDTPGQACHVTVCNDGTQEGSEPCDDGNLTVGDGCNPFCEVEPSCTGGEPCNSACGDGMILPGDDEDCDDGNTQDGDGCSSSCLVEAGWGCVLITDDLAATLEVPITYRDFIDEAGAIGSPHPDFGFYCCTQTDNLVEPFLGLDGKPVPTRMCMETDTEFDTAENCPSGDMLYSEDSFNQWYNDDTDVNITKVETLVLDQDTADSSYKYQDSQFFPWDGDTDGWVARGEETLTNTHNFGFTSEIRYWFEYKGGENLHFSGDDDVWVFINGQLVVDIGGVHGARVGSVTLPIDGQLDTDSEPELEVGKIYETVLFHAERHVTASNFDLTLTGFVSAQSECSTTCGDGIVAGDEICDDGINDESYGSCDTDCLGRGPFCGDNVLQGAHEDCDDGINLANHTQDTDPGCAPGCVWGAYCGDANIDGAFGEQCDDGVNAGGYNGCASNCWFDMRCGDGIVQEEFGEECDDGNLVSGDGCTRECLAQIIF